MGATASCIPWARPAVPDLAALIDRLEAAAARQAAAEAAAAARHEALLLAVVTTGREISAALYLLQDERRRKFERLFIVPSPAARPTSGGTPATSGRSSVRSCSCPSAATRARASRRAHNLLLTSEPL